MAGFRRAISVSVVAVVMLGAVGATLFTKNASAALATAPYTTAELNAKLYGGVQQAITWDKTCYDSLRENRRDGMPPRQAINSSPSYRGSQWISLADTATTNNSSRTAPIIVDYGTKSVTLQLNMVKFLCAALVSPDGAGADFAYTNARVVRSLTNANDRNPNPMGGNTNWPAMTDTRFRIDNIDVVQGNGRITGTAVGKYIGTARQENTRYWFANPVRFNFVSNSPNGLTEDTEVKVRFTLRGYNTYYYSTYQCYQNSNYYMYGNLNINDCDQNQVTLSIRVQVRNHFDMTPNVSLNGQSTIESGGAATVKNTVNKAAGSTDSVATDWRLTEYVYGPGTSLSAAQRSARDSASNPCGAFPTGGRTSCRTAQRNSAAIFRNATTTYSPQYAYSAPNTLAAGSKVCFVASISRPTQSSSPVWRHSQMLCLVVAKRPKVQFLGGDIRVGGDIETGTSSVGTTRKIYGSWVEYGAFAIGGVSGFASGSAYNGGSTLSADRLNMLTFANINDAGASSFGYFTLPSRNAALTGQFSTMNGGGAPASNLGNVASGVYKTTNLAINQSNIGQQGGRGKSIIIIATGTVTINGDITYRGPGGGDTFTNPRQIPQLVIVANKINIKNAVKRIDAWLLTTGANDSINTCSDYALAALLTIDRCNNKLTVNGPVSTSHLYLRRTAGADDANRAGNPAEVFNLRADSYVWGASQAVQQGKAQTVYTSELPPRF